MLIKDYIKEYTLGIYVPFKDVWGEVKEFFAEVAKLNKAGMAEEAQDVFHMLQLWLYWRFGMNGEIWRITRGSVKKFMDRKKVWQEIYVFAGLDKNISNYVGNYKKAEKVIKHLSGFGVSREKAKKAYEEIVLKKN